MLPFEFIGNGPPVSHQTRNPERLRAWQSAVRGAAKQYWPVELPPMRNQLKLSVTYYHDGVAVRIDNDNMVKLIQDALIGFVYKDDRQIY